MTKKKQAPPKRPKGIYIQAGVMSIFLIGFSILLVVLINASFSIRTKERIILNETRLETVSIHNRWTTGRRKRKETIHEVRIPRAEIQDTIAVLNLEPESQILIRSKAEDEMVLFSLGKSLPAYRAYLSLSRHLAIMYSGVVMLGLLVTFISVYLFRLVRVVRNPTH